MQRPKSKVKPKSKPQHFDNAASNSVDTKKPKRKDREERAQGTKGQERACSPCPPHCHRHGYLIYPPSLNLTFVCYEFSPFINTCFSLVLKLQRLKSPRSCKNDDDRDLQQEERESGDEGNASLVDYRTRNQAVMQIVVDYCHLACHVYWMSGPLTSSQIFPR